MNFATSALGQCSNDNYEMNEPLSRWTLESQLRTVSEKVMRGKIKNCLQNNSTLKEASGKKRKGKGKPV